MPPFLNRKRQLDNLINSDDNALKKIGKAVKDCLENNIDKEEEKYFDEVNFRISQLISSNESVVELDSEGRKAALKISSLTKQSSRKDFWGRLLFNLIRQFNPGNCLELGTCIGVSALFQAAAIKVNSSGSLTTIELSEERFNFAQKLFAETGNDFIHSINGDVEEVLTENLSGEKFDFVFVDANHKGEALIKYFSILCNLATDNAVIIFDDINWSPDMNKAWKEIRENVNVKYSFDLFEFGVCIFSNKQVNQNKKYSLPIFSY